MMGKYKKINFKNINSVTNPNSMNGLYPYRGKISAIDAECIIKQLPKKGMLLDPFCGSGTIVYIAQKYGFKSIGIDNNPLAVNLAKAKVYLKQDAFNVKLNTILKKAKKDYENKSFDAMPQNAKKSFHCNTANQIMSVLNYYDKMDDYIKGVFYGAIALAARGCNNYIWTSSTVGKNIEPKREIDFFEKFYEKAIKHSKYFNSIECKKSKIYQFDSRKLSKIVKPNSIDYVFTSPPYFDGLDYTAYYGKLIYDILGVDRIAIKKNLIQHVDTYRQDMQMVIDELKKVTKKDAILIFVVGDKKVNGEIINGGQFFNDIYKVSYVKQRNYTGSSSQVFDKLNNTKRSEQIIVWDRSKGDLK